MTYHPRTTALLLVAPYNDFLSEGGKLWPRVKAIAEEVRLLDHLRALVKTARGRGIKIFIVPHHRYEPGDYEIRAYFKDEHTVQDRVAFTIAPHSFVLTMRDDAARPGETNVALVGRGAFIDAGAENGVGRLVR